MVNIKFFKLLLLIIMISTQHIHSQNDTVKPVFSIRGYVQSQYQYFFIPDSVGATTPSFSYFSGGTFVGRFTNDRFAIRRGRTILSHGNAFYRSVLSFDITERGVHVKDMYVHFKERKYRTIGLSMGIFDNPFGFETGYSSSLRETPERTRISQTLFPRERDLGVMLSFDAPETSKLSFLKFNAAIVNGNSSAVETDRWKDFTGRIGIEQELVDNKLKLSAGFSMYKGYINHIFEPVDTIASNFDTKFFIFRFSDIDDPTGRTTKGFVMDSISTFESGRMGGKVERKYMCIDLQFSAETPWGKTKIVGEYIWGTQPTPVFHKNVEQAHIIYNGMHSFSPSGPMTGVAWPMHDQPQPYNPVSVGSRIKHHHTFVRKMSGGYLSLVQDIFKTPFQVVVKYDWYDPNTEIEGKAIVYDAETYLNDPDYIKPFLSPADLKFETLGFGLIYNYNDNVKLTIYYENVKNEIGDIKAYQGDFRLGRMPSPAFNRDISDDVLTIRLQYKF